MHQRFEVSARDIPTKAEMAFDLLLTAIEKRARPAMPVTLDVHLVTRGSTAPR